MEDAHSDHLLSAASILPALAGLAKYDILTRHLRTFHWPQVETTRYPLKHVIAFPQPLQAHGWLQ